MIVRITVANMLGPCVSPGGECVSPGGVCVSPGGAGSDLPPVGMSPAKIGADSAHMSASAIANRFIGVAPLRLRKMPGFLHKRGRSVIGTNNAGLLARWVRANYYPVCIRSTSR